MTRSFWCSNLLRGSDARVSCSIAAGGSAALGRAPRHPARRARGRYPGERGRMPAGWCGWPVGSRDVVVRVRAGDIRLRIAAFTPAPRQLCDSPRARCWNALPRAVGQQRARPGGGDGPARRCRHRLLRHRLRRSARRFGATASVRRVGSAHAPLTQPRYLEQLPIPLVSACAIPASTDLSNRLDDCAAAHHVRHRGMYRLRPKGSPGRRGRRSGRMLVSTPAVVLRTYRYSETSKIVRLATRDYGVQSAIAKGVLRPRSPFGAALETLSEGVAQLYHKETRELQTLAAFDVIELRRGLADDLGRFAGAAALSEVMLKMAPPAPVPAAYEAFILGLDTLVGAEPGQTDAAAVRWLWLLVGVLGFAPQLDACVRDGNPVSGTVAFSVAEGGVLCARCAGPQPPTKLPPHAYRDLVALNDEHAALPSLDAAHAAAHRRLIARFVRHHLDETGRNGKEPKSSAIDIWERRAWGPAQHGS